MWIRNLTPGNPLAEKARAGVNRILADRGEPQRPVNEILISAVGEEVEIRGRRAPAIATDPGSLLAGPATLSEALRAFDHWVTGKT
jgi:hypothetical protein